MVEFDPLFLRELVRLEKKLDPKPNDEVLLLEGDARGCGEGCCCWLEKEAS